MAKKSNPAKACKCNKCGATASSIAGTRHRRCSGQSDQPLRGRGANIPSANRGTWE